jgi:hypothetical protein
MNLLRRLWQHLFPKPTISFAGIYGSGPHDWVVVREVREQKDGAARGGPR